MAMVVGDNLTSQQQMFIDEVLMGGTIKDAALRAGYSAKSINSIASQLYNTPKIRRRIEEGHAIAAAKLGITRERWMAEMWALASANMADFADAIEKNKSIKDLDRRILSGLVEYEKTSGRTKVRLTDKLEALVQIGKSAGFFPKEEVNHNVNLSLEELINVSMKDEGELIDGDFTEVIEQQQLEEKTV